MLSCGVLPPSLAYMWCVILNIVLIYDTLHIITQYYNIAVCSVYRIVTYPVLQCTFYLYSIFVCCISFALYCIVHTLNLEKLYL